MRSLGRPGPQSPLRPGVARVMRCGMTLLVWGFIWGASGTALAILSPAPQCYVLPAICLPGFAWGVYVLLFRLVRAADGVLYLRASMDVARECGLEPLA